MAIFVWYILFSLPLAAKTAAPNIFCRYFSAYLQAFILALKKVKVRKGLLECEYLRTLKNMEICGNYPITKKHRFPNATSAFCSSFSCSDFGIVVSLRKNVKEALGIEVSEEFRKYAFHACHDYKYFSGYSNCEEYMEVKNDLFPKVKTKECSNDCLELEKGKVQIEFKVSLYFYWTSYHKECSYLTALEPFHNCIYYPQVKQQLFPSAKKEYCNTECLSLYTEIKKTLIDNIIESGPLIEYEKQCMYFNNALHFRHCIVYDKIRRDKFLNTNEENCDAKCLTFRKDLQKAEELISRRDITDEAEKECIYQNHLSKYEHCLIYKELKAEKFPFTFPNLCSNSCTNLQQKLSKLKSKEITYGNEKPCMYFKELRSEKKCIFYEDIRTQEFVNASIEFCHLCPLEDEFFDEYEKFLDLTDEDEAIVRCRFFQKFQSCDGFQRVQEKVFPNFNKDNCPTLLSLGRQTMDSCGNFNMIFYTCLIVFIVLKLF